MKAQLTLRQHTRLPGENVVDVIWDGKLVCTVTGADGPGVRIISKHLPDVHRGGIEALGVLTVFFAPSEGSGRE